jgi:hypothetical protein
LSSGLKTIILSILFKNSCEKYSGREALILLSAFSKSFIASFSFLSSISNQILFASFVSSS